MAGETVKLDIVEGGIKITEAGYEIRRIARVYGLTGTATNRIVDATAVTGLPALGALHPGRATCVLRDISGEIESLECVKLTLSYSDFVYPTSNVYSNPPSNSTIQTGAVVNAIETDMGYVATGTPGVYELQPQKILRTGKDAQPSLHTKYVPEPSIIITKTLTFDPQDIANTYVGTINFAGWTLRPYDAEGTWLCSGILGHSVDNGATYQTTYSFIRRKPNWSTVKYWLATKDDPARKEMLHCIPEDRTEGDGMLTIKDYLNTNFNNLNLP
jgi:hypothetical protein